MTEPETLGAIRRSRRDALSRLGSGRAVGRGRVRWRRRAPRRSRPANAGCTRAASAGSAPERATASPLDGGGPFPDPASRSQPEGVHGPSEIVDPRRFAWTDAGWRGVPLERSRALRAARRHVHAGGHVRGRRRATPGSSRDLGRHRHRADAGRRLSRVTQLGLRRRGALRPGPLLRHARRPAPARRRGPRPGTRRASRRGLQPLRPRRRLCRRRSARTSSPTRHRSPWGAGINLDGPHAAGRAGLLHRERPALDPRVPRRRPAPRRHARAWSTRARGTSSPSSPRACARRRSRARASC